MSQVGQLIRGYKYFSLRNQNGILPKGVIEDQNKLNDVETYLKFIEHKNEKEINKKLMILRQMERSSKRNTEKVEIVKRAILNTEIIPQEIIEEVEKGEN